RQRRRLSPVGRSSLHHRRDPERLGWHRPSGQHGVPRHLSIDQLRPVERTLAVSIDAEQHPLSVPFLDGAPKRLLIGGRWVEAESGRTMRTMNPATGEVLAEISENSAVDIDRAVAAARTAFEGPWRTWKPYDRQRALVRFADLVEANYDELSILDTL